ncbi:MAG: hypothetical protein R2834_13845 [Rhodothermales bacterium]
MERLAIFYIVILFFAPHDSIAQSRYDPLARPAGADPSFVDLMIRDDARSRDIPMRVYLPADRQPAPVVLFSHGLGGSRENGAYLGEHWAARGYVVVFMQHAGSDEGVWKGKRARQALKDARKAANAENLKLRIQDVHRVLDQLHAWQRVPEHPLAGRLDLEHVAMSGHSFGAITTQAVSGQAFPGQSLDARDARIDAAVIFSPSAPRRGSPEAAFGAVQTPWMLMTGTEDTAPIGDIELGDRLAVYPALPPGDKYEVVLDGAAHSAFSSSARLRDRASRNPNHHRVILALSTAFLDTYLKGDAAARAWLIGSGPAGVLEPKDRWQHK